ncbi:MAG TPA: GNAT family N-acetyltransferase [Pseudonocardia sp.]|nr:GNAT family N-acetyltransferase [Pseudonocardia sp.]
MKSTEPDHAVELRARPAVDDAELSALHAAAFGYRPHVVQAWTERLEEHSLTWVGAFDDGRMVGFANVAWDGGGHAFLLDVVVDPQRQGEGLGTSLVREATRLAAETGCEWLHVDFLPEHAGFYLDRCGFARSDAGVIRLAGF